MRKHTHGITTVTPLLMIYRPTCTGNVVKRQNPKARLFFSIWQNSGLGKQISCHHTEYFLPSCRDIAARLAGSGILLGGQCIWSTDLLTVTDSNHIGLGDSSDDVCGLKVANFL